jgi:hypothetical protein
MKNITVTRTTQATQFSVACPQAATRNLNDAVHGGSGASMHMAPAVKDVAHLRSRRPPV